MLGKVVTVVFETSGILVVKYNVRYKDFISIKNAESLSASSSNVITVIFFLFSHILSFCLPIGVFLPNLLWLTHHDDFEC